MSSRIINFIIRNSLAFAFILYEIIISIRVFFEMEVLTVQIFVHQLFWFNCVLAFFYFFFKKILKIDSDRLWILAGGSFLTFIPLVYSIIKGQPWVLNYIEPLSTAQVLKDVFTLLFRHSHNWPMFPELLALLISSSAVAFFFTRSLLKSFFTSLAALYISFFTLGFSWISVSADHPALFRFTTSFPPQQFYSLEMITLFSIIISAAHSSELFSAAKIIRHRLYFFMSLIVAVFSFQGLFMFLFIKKVYFPDIMVSFIPLSVIILTSGALLESEWRENAIIPVIISALSIAVLL